LSGPARYLVTGGAGFIGSHLAERLLGDGHRVRILDNFSSGRESNVEAIRPAGQDRLEVLRGDLTDPAVVSRAVEGTAGVFHLGALGSVPRSVAHPGPTHAANATGTLNVLVACRDLGVARVLLASSSSVYGALVTLPKKEEHPTRPISPYGLTKLIGEEYFRLFHELYGLETVALRYYNVFGPRQNPKGQYAAVIPIFLSRMLRGERPRVHGDGEQSRDFTYVSNVVDANLAAMTAPAAKVAGEVFNVAAGGRYSLNTLLDLLREILTVDIPAEYGPDRAGDIKHSQADVGKIRSALGFEARVSFAEGLRRTVAYFQEKQEAA